MAKKFKTIGILGGIGPSASADMYRRIISYMQTNYGAWEDQDFPKVMVYSTSLAGFDEKGIVEPDLVTADLVNAVKKLEQMGSELVVVACNTVHHFDEKMEAAINIPLVHMVEEACKDASSQGFKTVAIACSQSTRDLELYSNWVKRLGMEPIVADDDEQAIINKAIEAVMAGKQSGENINELKHVFNRFGKSGAEAVVLGCTELPLAIGQGDVEIKILDANDIVVKQAILLSISTD